MSKPSDNQISEKFKTSFENYHEDFNEEAWQMMKQKLSEKKKKLFPLWMITIGKAAIVIIILGIGILLPQKIQNHLVENKAFKQENSNSKKAIHQTHTQTSPSNNEKTTTIAENLKTKKPTEKNTNYTQKKNAIISDNTVKKNFSFNDTSKNAITLSDKKIPVLIPNSKKDTVKIAENIEKDTIKKKPQLLREDDFFYKNKKTTDKFRFGIALSSFYTASDIGANDNINIGGGVSTEYLISDKISISSGLSLANHNLNTENTGLFRSLEKSDVLSNNAAYTNTSETKINLIGLDIPLNVNLNFNKIAVSGGISSLFYLKEKYSSNYYSENTTNVYNNETGNYDLIYTYSNISKNESTKAFQTFDFAKLINISAAYKISLKKGMLIIGPYAKIPTGSLTAYHITFGYGGFNIQYKF